MPKKEGRRGFRSGATSSKDCQTLPGNTETRVHGHNIFENTQNTLPRVAIRQQVQHYIYCNSRHYAYFLCLSLSVSDKDMLLHSFFFLAITCLGCSVMMYTYINTYVYTYKYCVYFAPLPIIIHRGNDAKGDLCLS